MKTASKRVLIALSFVTILTASLGAPSAQAAVRRDETVMNSPGQKQDKPSLPTIIKRLLKPLGDILLPKG